jgi:hypothetical protein
MYKKMIINLNAHVTGADFTKQALILRGQHHAHLSVLK